MCIRDSFKLLDDCLALISLFTQDNCFKPLFFKKSCHFFFKCIIMPMNNKYFITVSYTHLDVYKRQAREGSILLLNRNDPALGIGDLAPLHPGHGVVQLSLIHI